MSDLIRRDDVLKALLGWETDPTDEEIEYTIKSIPTAEPKVGKWLWQLADNGWADHICSVCGYTKNIDIHVSLGWKYCPNCGAKMEGKTNE